MNLGPRELQADQNGIWVRDLFPADDQLCMICAALIAGYGAFNELILKIKMGENGRLKDPPVRKMTLFFGGCPNS